MQLEDKSGGGFLALTWQLAAAFGQGAGTMLVTRAAAEKIAEHYQQGLRDIRSPEDDLLKLVVFMRALGAASAMWSLRRGGAMIDVEDVGAAIGKLKGAQPFPLGECPACMERFNPGAPIER